MLDFVGGDRDDSGSCHCFDLLSFLSFAVILQANLL